MSRNDETVVVPTELEAAVLGDIWKNGPCTAYSIRQHFLRSPSPRWSGSAGAIYPLIRRLEGQGLVRSKAGARGKRKQQDYQLTRQGRNVFRRWVRQPTPDFGTGLLHDPLRTKIFFLDVLTNTQAQSFVNDALDVIRNQLSSLGGARSRTYRSRTYRSDEGSRNWGLKSVQIKLGCWGQKRPKWPNRRSSVPTT